MFVCTFVIVNHKYGEGFLKMGFELFTGIPCGQNALQCTSL